jgi:hypothetical protein
MLRMAALASSVVASTPTVLPLTRPCSLSTRSTQSKTAWCVASSMRLRITDSVEWSGVARSRAYPRNSRSPSESAQRQAMPRSESIPSKYPISSIRKYTPGATPGRPTSDA